MLCTIVVYVLLVIESQYTNNNMYMFCLWLVNFLYTNRAYVLSRLLLAEDK